MSGYKCSASDTFCAIRVYEQEVIIVPVLLLAFFVGTFIMLLLLRFCPEKVNRRSHGNRVRPKRSRKMLNGIDAPIGLNVLEHEAINLDGPTYSTFTPPQSSHAPQLAFPELTKMRMPESFDQVSCFPYTFSLKPNDCVSLYPARMDGKDVILRTLKESANANERQTFLGFASFLSQLGPHPFLPTMLGVVTMRAPMVIVMEEMANRDLLGFLWRCRQDHSGTDAPCDITERRIFTMATHVASALDYLHKKGIVHGDIGARNVLVSRELTAKLWGLNGVYRRIQGIAPKEVPMSKKWQAPEVLARREATTSSDIWSFGILLYEMATLGDPPFADVSVNELLQYLQRGKTLKKPANCSSSLYSVIKACCHWKEQDRPTLAEVTRKLNSGEKTANDRDVLRVPEPIGIERYVQQAGYGENSCYSVL